MIAAAPLFITDEEVKAVFTLERAYESQRDAFLSLESGTSHLAPRVLLPPVGAGPLTFSYVARLHPDSGVVAKIGSVQSRNSHKGIPVVSALLMCLHPQSGEPVAIIEGTSVTTLRTAAASAVAVSALRRGRHGLRVAIVGAGVQGIAHLNAIGRLDFVKQIDLVSRPGRQVDIRPYAGTTPVNVADDTSVICEADVVILCTSSTVPVVGAVDLKSDAIVISIGSYGPEISEVRADVVASATLVVVDHLPTALSHAGPVIAAVAANTVNSDELTELGAIVAGRITVPDGLIFYNSVGIGVQDAAAAWAIMSALTGDD